MVPVFGEDVSNWKLFKILFNSGIEPDFLASRIDWLRIKMVYTKNVSIKETKWKRFFKKVFGTHQVEIYLCPIESLPENHCHTAMNLHSNLNSNF